ncbi:MAG: transglycosylase SLT domain-containing protein [Rhodospirillales bacterium]|nr:transglycosylase SLT domain-containing protein [Rhodospirillales bacterium]
MALAERAMRIPRDLLAAIARAESGRPVAVDRVAGPWPWTVNAEGHGLFFDTKAEAMEKADALLTAGVRNIDVGCVQINLASHPDAFLDLEEAFDPLANATYGAAYLKALFMETGSWPEAVGRYHSPTRSRNSAYRDKVLDLWNRGRGRPVLITGDEQQARRHPALGAAAGTARLPAVGVGAPSPPAGIGADAVDELRSRLEALAPR